MGPGLDIVAHIRYGNPEGIPSIPFLDGDGVVEIPGVFPVYRDGHLSPQIHPSNHLFIAHPLGDSLRLPEYRCRKTMRQIVFPDYHPRKNLRVPRKTQDVNNPSLGVSRNGRVLGDLGDNNLIFLGLHDMLLGDNDLKQVPVVIRNHPTETVTGYESPHNPVSPSFQDPDNPAFPPLSPSLPQGFYANRDPITMHRLAKIPGLNKDIGLVPILHDDETVPIGVTLEAAHHHIHPRGQTIPSPLDPDDLTFRGHLIQEDF